MTNFDVMRNLIDEFDQMCRTVEMENKALERKIEEKNEVAYFNMCTELAPYYELYLDKQLPSIYIELDMEVERYNEICVPVICFHARYVYVATRSKFGIDRGLRMHMITKRRDFKAYEDLNLGGDDIAVIVAKEWFDHADEFDRKFTTEVQKILTAKAEKRNRENEQLKNMLN